MIDYDLSKIKAFAFDVDGVLSCNNVMLFEGAQPCRTANIKDGYAMQLAIKQGYDIAIITGGRSQAVRIRYEGLGIKDIFLGAGVKIKVFNTWEMTYPTSKSCSNAVARVVPMMRHTKSSK